MNHPVGNDYSDAGATAADSGTDPDATVDVVTYGLGDVDTDVLGTYTIIYTATDSDGNRATPVVRTVTVVDETAPTIVLNGNAAISHPVGNDYTDASANVSDNYDDGLVVTTSGLASLDVDVLMLHLDLHRQ